jgi:predicted RNase H-like nuclease (RuvC/YqgF family)
MSVDPENLKLRMLRDMREEHAASLEAMNAQMRAVRRFYEQTNTILDRLDAMDANLLSFRSETGRALRQIQGDIAAMENQNIARHGESIKLMNRMRDAETEIEELKAAP